jgi:HEPN domain-containing protein
MIEQPERTKLARQWLVKAAEDLVAARHLLGLADEECPFSAVAFHAQQCVEKCLKALLTARGIDFPKIHDIGELVELLPSDDRPPIGVLLQEKLTDYATVSRYPGDDAPLGRVEAAEAADAAATVNRAARARLGAVEPS